MKPHARISIGLVAATLLGLALPAFSAVSHVSGSGNRSISGTVTSLGSPIAGICVAAWDEMSAFPTAPWWSDRMGVGITDPQGRFTISRLPANLYRIRFMDCPYENRYDPSSTVGRMPDGPSTGIVAEYWHDQMTYLLAEEIDLRTGDASGIDAEVTKARRLPPLP